MSIGLAMAAAVSLNLAPAALANVKYANDCDPICHVLDDGAAKSAKMEKDMKEAGPGSSSGAGGPSSRARASARAGLSPSSPASPSRAGPAPLGLARVFRQRLRGKRAHWPRSSEFR